ncbi:hypothetical protein AMTR_s00017p00242860 [Amborella trichopoda]|uniref:GATA-type domain-containing protein n=2 Tax=Amborella trichopoda TaxID=13333 RepID=W1PM36_AMBTC|nr:hypothetical protein AMTR_s00017p00242860 [Amborella trichopoda]
MAYPIVLDMDWVGGSFGIENILNFSNEEMAQLCEYDEEAVERETTQQQQGTTPSPNSAQSSGEPIFPPVELLQAESGPQKPWRRPRSKRPRPAPRVWTLSPQEIGSPGKGFPAKKWPEREAPARRCSHCLVEKTPQWRMGPMGPRTLCNACGVRYKSGRLFPEYRPAASPTFRLDLHSNSHRKVLEMRRGNTNNVLVN